MQLKMETTTQQQQQLQQQVPTKQHLELLDKIKSETGNSEQLVLQTTSGGALQDQQTPEQQQQGGSIVGVVVETSQANANETEDQHQPQYVVLHRTQQRRILTTAGTLEQLGEPREGENTTNANNTSPASATAVHHEYQRPHNSPITHFVQMAPLNTDGRPTSTATESILYTYSDQNIISNDVTAIKIETIEKNDTTVDGQQLHQQHQSSQQCPTPNNAYADIVVPTDAALQHHHQHQAAVAATMHIVSPSTPVSHAAHSGLRFVIEDGRYSSTNGEADGHSSSTTMYFEPSPADANVNPNESKTYADLGNAYPFPPNSSFPTGNAYPPTLQGNAIYNVAAPAPTQFITKSDPNLNPLRQPSSGAYTTASFSDNTNPNDTALWSSVEYPNVSFTNYPLMNDYTSNNMAPHWTPEISYEGALTGNTTVTPPTHVTMADMKCDACNTPYTRKGAEFFCGSCASCVRVNPRMQPRQAKPKTATAPNNRRNGVSCANCQTTSTTLWRRNNEGNPVCNACGLYYKLHNQVRPLSMKKDGIQKRKRKPKNNGGAPIHRALPSMPQNANLMVNNAPLYPSQVQLNILSSSQHNSSPELHDMSTTSTATVVRAGGDSRVVAISLNPATTADATVATLSMARQHTGGGSHSPYNQPPAQSHSPHLPNSSTLNRQIAQSVPPMESTRNSNGELTPSVITRTGLPERSSNN